MSRAITLDTDMHVAGGVCSLLYSALQHCCHNVPRGSIGTDPIERQVCHAQSLWRPTCMWLKEFAPFCRAHSNTAATTSHAATSAPTLLNGKYVTRNHFGDRHACGWRSLLTSVQRTPTLLPC